MISRALINIYRGALQRNLARYSSQARPEDNQDQPELKQERKLYEREED